MPGVDTLAARLDLDEGDYWRARPFRQPGGGRDARGSFAQAGPDRAGHDQERAARARGHDAALWRLVQAEAQADRQLARGLGKLWRDERYRPLGYVRATDFVREHLGIKESRARWLARLGQQLAEIPELDQALAQGRINASQVIALTPVVSPTTPAAERRAWIERATGTTVRALRREVLAERQRRLELASADAGAPRPGANSTAGDSDSATLAATRDDGDRRIISLADLEVPPGGWMTIPAPARVAVLWHGAVDLARAASGQQLSQGHCAEFIFAEYLSAFGGPLAGEEDTNLPRTERERRLQILFEALNRRHRVKLGKPALPAAGGDEAPLEAGAGRRAPSPLPTPVADIRLPEDCVVDETGDPWQLAATLERLSHVKKRLRYDIAGLLRRLHVEAGWHALGFASFEDYCEQRLGVGLRRAERLIRFRRGLERLRRLRRAYLAGGISYTAAQLLLTIVHRSTEKAWVAWAEGITYRELERVVEYARTYALPGAAPAVLERWARALVSQGFARQGNGAGERGQEPDGATAFAAEEARAAEAGEARAPESGEPRAAEAGVHSAAAPATAFAAAPRALAALASPGEEIPLGYALPPSAPGALPTIRGLPADLAFADPERCVARIRFWLPTDALELAHRALHRCRRLMPDPLGPTWSYLEIILVHFIQSIDTPAAREANRRHPIIARDEFRCSVPGCTSRAILHDHHLEPRAQGGSNTPSNRTTLCAGHHLAGVHLGILEIGGWAPHALTTRLGIHPHSGRALACYQNERRVRPEVAQAALAAWRRWLRQGGEAEASVRRVAMG